MRVAIVAFNNLKFSPYILPYVSVLKKLDAQIELISYNRLGIKEKFEDGILREINWEKKKNKALNFLNFKSQVSKIIKKEAYDFIIVLTTFPAVLLSGVLISHYKGRYLVDVRDFTYEDNFLYYYIEKKVLKNALLRVVSSPGFKNFLPVNDYYLYQNVAAEYKKGANKFTRNNGDKIVIGYVGSISYASNCKKLIDIVRNDNKFCFYFYGNETGRMPVTNYVKDCNCERIKCFGEYLPNKKSEIIESIDILFNVYGNGTPLVKYALSNKLYDSMFFKKPLLVSTDTDMQRQTEGFSFAVESESLQNLDALYDWYMNINPERYEKYANEYINNVFKSNEKFELKLIDTLKMLGI